MIDAEIIGRRIKALRKQKGVSQEMMALDLGMYQADISNLERAMSGSGITDLLRLDAIADYFGIPLGELISGVEPEARQIPENEQTDHMRGTEVIAEARSLVSEYVYASEIRLQAANGRIDTVSFVEIDDAPYFYCSAGSLIDDIVRDPDDADHRKKIRPHCFLSGEDYADIFDNVSSEWIDICRYLICIATEADSAALIERTLGKTFAEIDVPIPSREPEALFHADYSDLSAVYRYRLMVEANIKSPSAFGDMVDVVKREKAILEKLKAACVSEEAYKVWKKDLINAKLEYAMKTRKFMSCSYFFIGMGKYKEILPEEQVECFKNFINSNGSGFFIGAQPATKREIRTFISGHIADELLDAES